MNKEIKDKIKKDIFRFYGEYKLSFKEKIFEPRELKYMKIFRKVNGTRNIIVKNYYKFLLHKLSKKTMIQIPHSTQIGEGFYIGHCGRVIINHNVTIGRNVNVATGVTIGKINRGSKKGTPSIGDNVWIGTNAVIVGKISIGTDVVIAPNAYVNFDVPDHSVVIGNPGVIHFKSNATKDYICNTV